MHLATLTAFLEPDVDAAAVVPVQIFSPLQLARAMVHSVPYFLDTKQLVASLLRTRRPSQTSGKHFYCRRRAEYESQHTASIAFPIVSTYNCRTVK